MRTLYVYHYEEINNDRIKLGKKPLFKIGDTTIEASTAREAALKRIEQQDSTSNFEKLVLDYVKEIPDTFMSDTIHVDQQFHKWLAEKHDIYKYRKDADREWYGEFENIEEIIKYINLFIENKFVANDFKMRKSQQAAHDKIVEYFKNNDFGEFLLAAKMRFGKNFVFLNAIKTLKFHNIIVTTYKPEVFASLKDDIESHVLFTNFNFVFYKDRREKLNLPEDKTNIVVCSAQMAGYKYNDETNEIEGKFNKKNLEHLSTFKWDLLVTDECHYGTETYNFKNICETLKCKKTLFISGTPFKTIGNYSDNALYMYTYLDEQNEPNNTLAKLHQYGIEMDSKLIAAYKKYKEIVDYPTMTKLFNADENGNFETPDVARQMLDYILNDINKFDNPINHMFALLDHKNSCKACAKYINEQYGDKFLAIDASNDVFSVTGENGLKANIHDGIIDNKKTITFSCGRFVEGTSIKEWNCVIMLHDGSSPERYFQAMFRGQTPAKDKHDFYVIDYNPNRMLCMNHFLIDELPTGEKSILKNTKKQNAKEWLKASPIIVICNDSDQTRKIITYENIENVYFHNDKIGANKMTDSSIMSRLQFININNETLTNIMDCKGKMSVQNKDVLITDNGLQGGKNKVSKTDSVKETKEKQKKNKEYTLSELVAFAKEISKFLPRYILAYNCKSLLNVIETCKLNNDNNKESFFIYTGYDFDIFNLMYESNVFNEDGFNNAINCFWDELFEVIQMDANANNYFNLRWNIYK